MRVLVLEDDPDIAQLIVNLLKSDGFAVDHISRAKEAAFAGKTNDYDVMVFDVNLPDGNGMDVCADIRTVKKEVPVIFLTVLSDIPSKVKAFDSGGDDYLVKPFSLDELRVRVKALLRRPKLPIPDVLSVSGLVLDSKKHTLTRDGKPVELRVKEFALLEYIMRNAGTVLSRGMMLEHVWDMNVDPFTNTIDVHIRSIRKKMNDDEGNVIKTIHGMGYKIGD